MNKTTDNSNWQLFLTGRHRRLTRLWQSFFTGWGLIFLIILAISPMMFRNITWTIIDSLNLGNVHEHNLSMTNLAIRGTDNNDDPFFLAAYTAVQRFDEPDVIQFVRPHAILQRRNGNQIITDNITSDTGRYYADRIILTGNVLIESSDNSTVRTREMEILLRD